MTTSGVASRLSLGALLLASVISFSAQAGQKIHFKAGSVELSKSHLFDVALTSGSADYVIQFEKTMTSFERKQVQELGIKIFSYLPDDAWIVRADAGQISALRKLNNFKGATLYKPMFKMSPYFESFSVFTQNQKHRVLVRAFSAADAKSVAHTAKAIGARFVNEGKYLVVEADEGQIIDLAQATGIEYMEPYVQMKSMQMDLMEGENGPATTFKGDYTDLDGFETGTKIMNMDYAWNAGLAGKGQIVSMADTGLDTGDLGTIHADFKGSVLKGYAFGMFSKSWSDPMGHGTHVAGSVLGRGAASNGMLKGSAYEADFIPQGMWSPVADNLTVPPKLEKLFEAAYKDGAKIHTNSWGSPKNLGGYDSFSSQVDEYMWKNDDFLAIFAAGNSGVDMDKDGRIDGGSISSPGTAKNCLTVGASENLNSTGGIQAQIKQLKIAAQIWPAEPIWSSKISDNPKGIAMFSSRGPTLDGRIKPDVVAPGTNILSARSHEKGASELWGAYNNDYVYSGGTSMATPLTAGAVAVARQYMIEKMRVASPSAAAVKAFTMNTATDLFPGQYGEGGKAAGQELLTRRPNSDEGFGLVDMKTIVAAAGTTKVVDERVGLKEGASQTVTITMNRPGKLIATMTYTDAPASPSAATALVNDLSMTLVKTGGNILAMDTVNNTEHIETDLQAGTYQLVIKGEKVPQLRNGQGQPFALVYSIK